MLITYAAVPSNYVAALFLLAVGAQAAPQVVAAEPSAVLEWARPGDTATAPLDAWLIQFGIQYRLMGNVSNIPGPAGTSFGDTRTYDFTRQRLRLNVDVEPKDSGAGAFLQFEFRGGAGGSGPGVTDPREQEPTLNPFNFIDARGLRFGYLWWEPSDAERLEAGVVPISDEFGDTLFSADWDWSVGGFQYLVEDKGYRLRLGAMHLVEGVGSTDASGIGDDGWMAVADLDFAPNEDGLELGLHAYALAVEEGLPLGGTQQLWMGPTAKYESGALRSSALAVLNVGQVGVGTLDADGGVSSGFTADDAQTHLGFALGLESEASFDSWGLSLQTLYTSGDREGDFDSRFVTPQGLFGTKGYWGYTHIFTANGPSDVNDLGLEIGNSGAGLWTVQAQADLELSAKSELRLALGTFAANQNRNGSSHLGNEVALTMQTQLSPMLTLDVGLAYAQLGGFYADNPDDLWEGFVRLQLQN